MSTTPPSFVTMLVHMIAYCVVSREVVFKLLTAEQDKFLCSHKENLVWSNSGSERKSCFEFYNFNEAFDANRPISLVKYNNVVFLIKQIQLKMK